MTVKKGETVILNNGKGMIGHGTECKVTKVAGPYVHLKAKWMCGKSHVFNVNQIIGVMRRKEMIHKIAIKKAQDLINNSDNLIELMKNGCIGVNESQNHELEELHEELFQDKKVIKG